MIVTHCPPSTTEFKARAVRYLSCLLDHPRLTGPTLPTEFNGLLWIDNVPKRVTGGYWEIMGNNIVIGAEGANTPLIDRLAILSALSAMLGVSTDPVIQQKVMTALTRILQESTTTIYGALVASVARPNRLAINMSQCLVAAELNNAWFLPSGAPVEVTDSWITMNF